MLLYIFYYLSVYIHSLLIKQDFKNPKHTFHKAFKKALIISWLLYEKCLKGFLIILLIYYSKALQVGSVENDLV